MSLNAPIWCYLTADALKAVGVLMAHGMDGDLALAVLERCWPEKEIYDIPGSEEPWTPDSSA